ncbi:MAG: MipA/OmpV family protein [Rhodomicrobium sp.]|nr:MipA/OmpV family protein [Rhodomicrobium sp.]
MRRISGSIIALSVSAALGSASAADLPGSYKDPSGETDWTVTSITVGGIAVVKPTYEGSEEYEVVGFPYLFPKFAGGPGFFSRIEARGLDDVRFTLIDRDGFIAGPLGGYNFGRDEDDGDLLEGLGDVDGGVVLGGFVGYRWQWLQFDVSYHHTLGDDGGYQVRFGVEAKKPISERVTLLGRIGATYADDEYMQNYFGVEAGASAIGLPAFDAEAGFKDVNVQVGLEADLDANWSLRASLRYSHLIGDASDSPIVETDDQFTGLLGVSYKFDTAR